MHIEPGIVDAAKMGLAVATAAGAMAYAAKETMRDLAQSNIASFAVRAFAATLGTFLCFEILPHFAVGVSEVHFILGTTLFLVLGAAPAAFGLALGLLVQGMFFAPSDMPMYFVNVTTLLAPLFAMTYVARKVIPEGTAYVDLAYADVLKLSAVFQSGIIAWVAFWAFYGQGFGVETFQSVWTFALAYLTVILIEPLVDLAILWAAKTWRKPEGSAFVHARLYTAA